VILPGHEAGVASLTTLAHLFGCASTVRLPDEHRPDVLRCDIAGEILYVGEAKYAERPTDIAAVARLRCYLGWIKAYRAEGDRAAILALCFTRAEDGPAWRRALLGAIREAALPPPDVRADKIDGVTNVLLFWWRFSGGRV
jgi:hypothetical protein